MSPPAWLGCLIVLALLVLARPYNGLRHDGVLYLGQALLHVWPDVFSQDIFFAHGSQDAFSLASHVLSRLYRAVGIDVTHLVVPFVAQVALLGVAWRLTKALPLMHRWLGLAAIATASHVYGGHAIFAFGERYLTARTFAEPLALAALAFLQARRWAWAGASLLLAGLFHPLVALPAGVIAWILLTLEDRRWIWAALLSLFPLAGAWLGLKPFDGLLRTIDADWLSQVGTSSPHLFLSTWRPGDWQIVFFDLAVLACAARLPLVPLARLAKAVGIAVVALMGLSFVLADLAHNVLGTQLQLWRVLWVAHVLALTVTPALIIGWWSQVPSRLVAAAFILAAVAVNAGWTMGWVFLGWWAAASALNYRQVALSQGVTRLALVATLLAAVAVSLAAAGKLAMTSLAGQAEPSSFRVFLMVAAITPILSVTLAAVLLRFATGDRPRAILPGLIGLLMLAVGSVHWDHRTEWSKYVDSALDRTHPFSQRIPPDAQVYWHEDLAATWAVLRRASYFSSAQAAGVVFNRGTAVAFATRQKAFAKLLLQESICSVVDALAVMDKEPSSAAGGPTDCVPTAEVIAEICQSDPQLGYLIFKFPLESGVIDRWTFHPKEGAPTTYYLHDCVHLR